MTPAEGNDLASAAGRHGRGREGTTSPLAALERTRHYSYRTECTYADWVRRFLDYAAQQQDVPHPRVESEVVRVKIATRRPPPTS